MGLSLVEGVSHVGKFSGGHSPRLIFLEGGVAHNHDHRVGYLAYTTVIQ